jgi:hypothetical protein
MSNTTINNTIGDVLHSIDSAQFTSQLNVLNKELEDIYETCGFPQFRRMVLQFLYTLLVYQKPIGYTQRWEIAGLAHSIARMPCMRQLYLRNDILPSLRTELETFLERAFDGELRLASEQDFLDELQIELKNSKTRFYKSCRIRCAVFKNEMCSVVMHPDRIEKILNKHGFEMLEELFGY